MKVAAITLRPGNVIDHNGKMMVVSKYEIMQPGKGASVIQVEMRDIRTGNKDNVRYRTQETVERHRLDQADYQYLFNDGEENYTFMNTETFEQVEIKKEIIGEPQVDFLQDGMIVQVESFEGEALSVEMPAHVTVTVETTDAVIKGQTATTSYKPAIVDGGIKVMVPPFVDAGTKIVVKVEDGSYVERAK